MKSSIGASPILRLDAELHFRPAIATLHRVAVTLHLAAFFTTAQTYRLPSLLVQDVITYRLKQAV